MKTAYQVYARKYRPHQFDDVVGQESVVKTIVNSLQKGRVAHAYLFTGMRGVGKTTTARIFAKALNCEQSPTVTPCDTCSSCKEIDQGISINVKEIDGATYTKVDNIRELKDDADFVPSGSNFKIYIIDEVHMLSKSAFNALLKILEEPPPRVKFIFATTELQKIPKTIASRCQVFNFKKVPQKIIVATLRKIAVSEELNISEEALMEISRASDGSLRDAERLFDQIISFCGENPDDEEIMEFLGVADHKLLSAFISSIKEKDYESIIRLFHSEVLPRMDCMDFLQHMLEYIKDLTVINSLQDKSDNILHYSDINLELLKKTAQPFTNIELEYLFSIFSRTMLDGRNSPVPELLVEMMLIKAADMSVFHALPEIVELLKSNKDILNELRSRVVVQHKPEQASKPLQQNQAPYKSISPSPEKPSPQKPEPVAEQKAVEPLPEQIAEETISQKNDSESWTQIVHAAGQIRASLLNVLKDWEMVKKEQNSITLRLKKESSFLHKRLADNNENLDALKEACRKVFRHDVRIILEQNSAQNGSNNESNQPLGEKPLRPKKEGNNLDSHQTFLVQKALEKFDGHVV
ncbi:MAG: DNA polymerase III subunit gamma/tau [Nitrospinae bacterium]|nr:DNA polymerase III subunit gamma/tau [Nitrospinota bacterium]